MNRPRPVELLPVRRGGTGGLGATALDSDRRATPDSDEPATPDSDGRDGGRVRDNRAVSPVVGIVLLLGITVVLGAVAAPMVFGFASDSAVDAPSAEFGFVYTESTPEATDSFGSTGDGFSETGVVRVIFQRGDPLPAEQIRIQSDEGTQYLDDTDAYAAGETVYPGDRFSVWASRGERISIIWESADGEESDILGVFTIETVSDLPPGVPAPTTGCSYVESQLPGDVTIDGEVVECDLDQYSIDDISFLDGGTVLGEVAGAGTITATNGETYFGDVVSGTDGSGGDITADASTFEGDVVANGSGSVDLDGGSTVTGTLTADQHVTVDGDSSVARGIEARNGDVTVGDGSTAGGKITAAGSVTVGSADVGNDVTAGGAVDFDGTSLQGSVDATGDVTVDGGTVTGDIETDGDVYLTDATVEGTITAGGTIHITNSEAGGPVDADGDVTVTDSTVDERALPDGQLTCTNSRINQQNCAEYRTPYHEVTIQSTNAPVGDGETLEVLATVENTGFGGTQDLTLDIDGVQVDSTPVHIGRHQQTTKTLTWSTDGDDSGEHTATVASPDTQDSETVTVTDQGSPAFDVTLDSYDATVPEGSTVEFEASVENSGGAPGTQTIELRQADGTVLDSTDESLQPDESTQVTLSWPTDGSDTGTHDITVASDDDSVTREVTVEAVVYDIQDLTLRSGHGNSIEVVVTLETEDEDAWIEARGIRKNKGVHDSATLEVGPSEDEYVVTINGANQVDRVEVSLYDGGDTEMDMEEAQY